MIKARCPVLGFAAFSGTGKTTLLEKLIPLLREQGIRVGVIKHAHHQFDIDKEGKDSYRLRHAGAGQVLIASKNRWALMVETPEQDSDPELQNMIDKLDQTRLDLILIEGFKHVAFNKIELHRHTTGKPLIYPNDDSIIAIATDSPKIIQTQLPILDINSPQAIGTFIQQHIRH